MPRSSPPADFNIHVDSSCLTDSKDLQMAPAERTASDQTIVRHDSWFEEKTAVKEDRAADEVAFVVDVNEEQVQEDGHKEQQNEAKPLEDQNTSDARERQINRIQAQIQAAARKVVASIEKDHYGGHEDSVLSTKTDESDDQGGSQMTYDDGTELTYGEGTELTYDGTETSYEPHSEPEEEAAGDSSSHHDGDIDDDDVFSRNSGHSARSSLNSVHDLSSADEVHAKELTSPKVGEEAIQSSPAPEEDDTISRIPSSSCYTPRDATPITPSKVLSRPPFRTPSSVRAMQMSSPTPSLFSSPRSSKRHLTTVSRNGTPLSSHSPSKSRTPTRFKVKKDPLVLLHATVLPLTWKYSHVISYPDLPTSLRRVKENWRLLQEKLGDTVLERGILLPHPHESYEILEERILEALEIPVRPRARILKCGHYLGPETPSSDEEDVVYYEGGTKVDSDRRWCDICGRSVRLEGMDTADRGSETRFRVKIYASNGLMRAGAWAACWREMERIDVEIEPFIEGELFAELENFFAVAVVPKEIAHEESDGFIDEETGPEQENSFQVEDHAEQDAHIRAQQEEEMARTLMEEEEIHRRTQEDEDIRRRLQDEQRMREIYGEHAPTRETSRPRPSSRNLSRSSLDDDSLSDLLLKAFKVAMKDKKNVAICVLSLLVLLLALRSGSTVPKSPQVNMTDSEPTKDIGINVERLTAFDPPDNMAEIPVNIPELSKDIAPAEPCIHPAEKHDVEVTNEAQKDQPIVQVEAKDIPIVDRPVPEATAEQMQLSMDRPELALEAAIVDPADNEKERN